MIKPRPGTVTVSVESSSAALVAVGLKLCPLGPQAGRIAGPTITVFKPSRCRDRRWVRSSGRRGSKPCAIVWNEREKLPSRNDICRWHRGGMSTGDLLVSSSDEYWRTKSDTQDRRHRDERNGEFQGTDRCHRRTSDGCHCRNYGGVGIGQ